MGFCHYEGVGHVLEKREERHRRTDHEHGVGEQLLKGRYPFFRQRLPARIVEHEPEHDAHSEGGDDGDEAREDGG